MEKDSLEKRIEELEARFEQERKKEVRKKMNLNPAQRKILLVAIILIAIMILFPPWKFSLNVEAASVNDFYGYGIIFLKPDIKRYIRKRLNPLDMYLSENAFNTFVRVGSFNIDYGRLFLQIFVVALITGGLIIYKKEG